MSLKSLSTRLAVMAGSVAMVAIFGSALVGAQDATAGDRTFADIYDRISPSVVAISVEKAGTVSSGVVPGGNSPLPLPQDAQPQRGLGSGFVMSKDGYIITNAHVVEGETQMEVDFNDGTLARAKVIGTDLDSDIAVIQVQDVPAEKLFPVTFANSDDLYIGQSVLAIGSPFGELWTLTTGIISGRDRVIQGLTNYSIGGVIQTDAAINPGNSGGPLLDLSGNVVGMNSQIASSSGSGSGVGFAIPSNLIQRAAKDLIDKGYVEYSYLGISGGDVTLNVIEALKMPNDTRGVVVGDVSAGGPADRAQLHAAQSDGTSPDATLTSADVITAINDHPLRGMADLISYLASDTKPGDKVTLSVLRNGKDEMKIDVTLTPRPQATQS